MAISYTLLNASNIGEDNFVIGTAGDDQFTAGYGADTIEAGNGNDRVYGGIGADIVNGQNGNDYINGDNGNDRVRGGEGDDAVFGGGGNDNVYGGWGNDILAGNSGDDTLYGGRPNAIRPAGETDSDVFIFDRRDGNDRVMDFTKGEDKVVLLDGGDHTLFYNAVSGNTKLTYGETTVIFYNVELSEADIATLDFSVGQDSPGASDSLSAAQINQIFDIDPILY
ncbi:calcium-binding protein (plasmid) [Limimaricola variabilis]